ncbi:hypothetical protein HDU76_008268 [Blyttiomyces sp. JEL0837]|nr:hypothetical protein HDU76_008268 [Blyttiomyces sp. JEL0837]
MHLDLITYLTLIMASMAVFTPHYANAKSYSKHSHSSHHLTQTTHITSRISAPLSVPTTQKPKSTPINSVPKTSSSKQSTSFIPPIDVPTSTSKSSIPPPPPKSTSTSSPPPPPPVVKSSSTSSSAPVAPTPQTGLTTGQGTYYYPSTTAGVVGVGACGKPIPNSAPVVAIGHHLYDTKTINGNPNNNAFCGMCVQVVGAKGTTYATVADRCEACQDVDLDLTIGIFSLVDDVAKGRVTLSWKFVSTSLCSGFSALNEVFGETSLPVELDAADEVQNEADEVTEDDNIVPDSENNAVVVRKRSRLVRRMLHL